MNPRLPKSILLPLAVGLVQILSGCLDSNSTDPGRSAGGSDEIDTRLAVDRTGRPVAGARIALVKAGDSTGKVVAVNATADDGSYPEFRVADGYYSVLVRDEADSLGKFVDSLQIESRKAPKGRDTLLSLGSVRGVVRVAQGHSPATVTVGLLGTDIVANVKSDGTFLIELVPGSLYTLAALPSLEGYGPLYKRIQIKDGQNLTLPDTLVMPVTGLPVPAGLTVAQDSMTGNVRISWMPVDHPDLMGYVLERVEGGVTTSSRYLTDSSWTDSLGAYWEAMPLSGPWPPRTLAYRVRSRSLTGLPDSRNVAMAFVAKPPTWTKGVTIPGPKLVQDSLTGNVRVSWSALQRPRVKGYLVERIQGGVVIGSSILRDTLYLDSLGRHWERLPLSGPWPGFTVGYRIAVVASDTARGPVLELQVRAPTWVGSVDSVRVSASQDDLTGNVRIHWSPSHHPHAAGYVVERIENGVARDLARTIDTNHVDSLGSYWSGLPLLGPWPVRNVSYRIRLVADSAGTDGWTAAATLEAKPPEWTKHVDSVRLSRSTDSVTGIASLTWNTPKHPDFAGWWISRTVDGIQDCTDTSSTGEWSEAKCPDPRFEVLDSTGSGKNSVRLVREKTGIVRYAVQVRRLSGVQELVAESSHPLEARHSITWRDSTISESDATARYEAFGGWILKRHVYNAKTVDAAISRDGVNWETIPNAMDVATGIGDSLWTVTLGPDGLHLTIRSRRTSLDWSARSVNLPSKTLAIKQLTVMNGKLVVGINPASDQWGGDSIWVLENDSTLLPGKIGGIGQDMSSMFNYRGIPVTQGLRVDEINGPGSTVVSVVESGATLTRKDLLWAGHGYSTLVGIVGQGGGALVSYASSSRKSMVYLPVAGDAVLMKDPSNPIPSVELRRENSFVFAGDLWVPLDGHVWKGKLNLPK